MCKVNLKDDQNVDYIYCIRYWGSVACSDFALQPLEVTDTTVSCNLSQRHRCSQQILDLADYLEMHFSSGPQMRQYKSPKSFSSDIPLLIELSNPMSFFDYFKDKFQSKDVMVTWDERHKPYNLNDIKEFCTKQKWICTEKRNLRGSEASVVIMYGLRKGHDFEYLTRAKTHLVVVAIVGEEEAGTYKYFCIFCSLNN